MLKWIKGFLKQESLGPPVQFIEVSKKEISEQYPSALDQLFAGELDGFLIRNFFTTAQLNTIMEKFPSIQDNGPAYTPVGFTYPMVFAEYARGLEQLDDQQIDARKTTYFAGIEAYNKSFADEYGVDAHHELETFFETISSGKKVRVPAGVNGKGSYPFATFRVLFSQEGIVSLHCGNFFQVAFDSFYQDLMEKADVFDQLSFFIVLQQAELGGELSVYNLRWQDGQHKTSHAENAEVLFANGSKVNVEKDKRITMEKLNPAPGDMILFQGGQLWHRVEQVLGDRDRVTFGGFMGYNKDRSEIVYWS